MTALLFFLLKLTSDPAYDKWSIMFKRNIVLLTLACFFLMSGYCFAEIPEESYSRNIDGMLYCGNDSAQTCYGRKGGKEGYFALIEEKSPGNWTVKAITDNNNGVRDNPNQEIIYFGKYLASVGLYYSCGTGDKCDIVANGADSGHFSCQDQLQKQSVAYSPCSSKFSIQHTHFLGDTYTIDISKLADVVKRLNLVEKVKEFKANKENVQGQCRTFKSRIKISPEIVDLTGTVKKPDIVDNEIKEGCDTSNLNDSTYHVSLSARDRYATVEISPATYDLKYNTEGYFLRPRVTVLKRTFFGVAPNKIYENHDLSITLRKIKIASLYTTDIEFVLDFVNKSDSAIAIDEIALHINDLVFTKRYSLELPPKVAKYGKIFLVGEKRGQSSKDIQSAVKTIDVTGDKSLFDSLTIELGIEVKYTLDNTGHRFNGNDRYLYVDIADGSPPDSQRMFPEEQPKSASPKDRQKRGKRGSRPLNQPIEPDNQN